MPAADRWPSARPDADGRQDPRPVRLDQGEALAPGAGATLGSIFPPGFTPECRPPLNADFFTQLQRITSKHQKLIRQVMSDVVGLFGSNFSLTLEEYFTQLEFLAEAVELTPAKGGAFSTSDLRTKRERLMGALAAVLEMSTDVAVRKGGG